MKHLLSTKDLSREEIEQIIAMADDFMPYASKEKRGAQLKGKILGALFYEPSTRTRLSFETAMTRLGGDVLSVTDIGTTSMGVKGETVADTAKVISNFVDIVAIRHPDVGSAKEFAENASVPVINAGDGINQHPSQALLDLYTIKKELGKIDGLTVGFSGDLKFGRTANSLSYLLANYDVKLKFIAPEELSMKPKVKKDLTEKGVTFEETEDFENGLNGLDVLYVSRVQKDRFTDMDEYEKLKDVYILTGKLVEEKNPDMLILHALPRVNEIAKDVDDLKGAAYFRQVQNGVAVRMALLSMLL